MKQEVHFRSAPRKNLVTSNSKRESGIGQRKTLETPNKDMWDLLKELDEPLDNCESLLKFWLVEKLDPEPNQKWQLVNPGTEQLKQNRKSLDATNRALDSDT